MSSYEARAKVISYFVVVQPDQESNNAFEIGDLSRGASDGGDKISSHPQKSSYAMIFTMIFTCLYQIIRTIPECCRKKQFHPRTR